MERGERFKSAVKSLAEAQGLHTDAALAEKAGVSTNTLRNWWRGKGLELGTLVNVADVLDRSVFDLLNLWQGRPQPPPEPTIAAGLTALVDELRRWRTEDRVRLDELEAMVDRLAAGALVSPGTPGEASPRAPRARAG